MRQRRYGNGCGTRWRHGPPRRDRRAVLRQTDRSRPWPHPCASRWLVPVAHGSGSAERPGVDGGEEIRVVGDGMQPMSAKTQQKRRACLRRSSGGQLRSQRKTTRTTTFSLNQFVSRPLVPLDTQAWTRWSTSPASPVGKIEMVDHEQPMAPMIIYGEHGHQLHQGEDGAMSEHWVPMTSYTKATPLHFRQGEAELCELQVRGSCCGRYGAGAARRMA